MEGADCGVLGAEVWGVLGAETSASAATVPAAGTAGLEVATCGAWPGRTPPSSAPAFPSHLLLLACIRWLKMRCSATILAH
eukprot:49-Pyramimonas_sp.AAC.1